MIVGFVNGGICVFNTAAWALEKRLTPCHGGLVTGFSFYSDSILEEFWVVASDRKAEEQAQRDVVNGAVVTATRNKLSGMWGGGAASGTPECQKKFGASDTEQGNGGLMYAVTK